MNADELSPALTRAFPDNPAQLSRLRERLATAAQQDGVLDVAYRVIDSPVGPLLLAATDQGLIRVAFALEGHDAVLQILADQVSPRILSAPGRLDAAARELDEYFAGRRHAFDLPLDWRLSAGFRRTVLNHLPEIGYGHTASYSAVAQLAGNPQGGPGRRHRLRDQPAAAGGAVPPRGPRRRQHGRLPRRPRSQAHPAHPGGGRSVTSTSLVTWQDRVDATDWAAVRADLDRYGCGLTGPLLQQRGGGRDRRPLPRRRAVPVHRQHGPVPLR